MTAKCLRPLFIQLDLHNLTQRLVVREKNTLWITMKGNWILIFSRQMIYFFLLGLIISPSIIHWQQKCTFNICLDRDNAKEARARAGNKTLRKWYMFTSRGEMIDADVNSCMPPQIEKKSAKIHLDWDVARAIWRFN